MRSVSLRIAAAFSLVLMTTLVPNLTIFAQNSGDQSALNGIPSKRV